MDCLPFEILREIHTLLPQSDTKAFRLVSKPAAAAGVEFLVPTLTFNLTKESLQRLEDVSCHPVISRYVRKIRYEFVSLKPYSDVESFLSDSEYEPSRIFDLRETSPPRTPKASPWTKADWKEWERSCFPFKENPFCLKKVQKLFTIYNQIVDEQNEIKSDDSDIKIIARAVSKLPNLKGLVTEKPHSLLSDRHRTLTKAFHKAPALLTAREFNDNDEPRQLASMLVPISKTNIHLEDFSFEINPKALIQPADTFRHMCNAFASARFANISFDHGPCEDSICDDCSNSMRSPKLHNFLKSAAGLIDLNLWLQTSECRAEMNLTDVFGTFSWSALRKLSICGLRTTENELIDFLTRHAGTLREVEMTFVWLKAGSWVRVVQRMKKSLRLTRAIFSTAVGTEDDREDWDTDEIYAWTRDLTDPGMLVSKTLRECLDFYICRGGKRDRNPLKNLAPNPWA